MREGEGLMQDVGAQKSAQNSVLETSVQRETECSRVEDSAELIKSLFETF